MQLAISVEGLFGLNWSRWKAMTQAVEQVGFSTLYCSDHFTFFAPPDADSLEVFTALTYLADHSQRIDFGTMVSPLSFRDPVMMARQAMAINDLSGGRMVLGVGSGWNEREHRMFGYELGDIRTRLDRLEEGLEVITRLIRSDDPASFDGRFYQLRDARLLPRPEYPLRLLVGGNGKQRVLPMVARYADIWNTDSLAPADVRERNDLLDALLVNEGRQPSDLRRTAMVFLMCWRTDAERERMIEIHQQVGNLTPPMPASEFVQFVKANYKALCGTPDEIVEQFRALEAAGIEEVMWHYLTPHSLEPLAVVAESVLPHFKTG